MKVQVIGYPNSPLRKAAELGVRRLGHDIDGHVPNCWRREQALPAEAVVVCGLRGGAGEAARYYSEQDGTRVVLIDHPHLARGEAEQFRVTPPDPRWLPTFDGDPPEDRLAALDIEASKPRTRRKAQVVLILGQRSGDPTHGLSRSEFEAWAQGVLETTRSLTDASVVWRPHPLEVYRLAGADDWSDPREESLEDAFDRTWVVVTHSSTAGLDALIAGLPVIAEGPSVYRHLGFEFQDFKNVKARPKADVDRLLRRLAYTQWSEVEIASGAPLKAFLGDAGDGAGEPAEGETEDGDEGPPEDDEAEPDEPDDETDEGPPEDDEAEPDDEDED